MACVVVWEIAAAKGEKAQALRTFLIKLSCGQMKWGKSFTNPALLAGLWVFISMQEVLDCHPPEVIVHVFSQSVLCGVKMQALRNHVESLESMLTTPCWVVSESPGRLGLGLA